MSGFNESHVEAAQDIADRGLEPCRIRFTFRFHKLKAPRHLRDKTIVIACERKNQIAVSCPKRRREGTSNEIAIHEDLDLYLVLGRRNSGPSAEDDHSGTSDVSIGAPEMDFETAMARITLRHNNIDGIVLDCISINIAKFIVGNQSLEATQLHLQLGGELETTIQAQIFDRKRHGTDDVNFSEDIAVVNEIFSKEDEMDVLDLQGVPDAVQPQMLTEEHTPEMDTLDLQSVPNAVQAQTITEEHTSESDDEPLEDGRSDISKTSTLQDDYEFASSNVNEGNGGHISISQCTSDTRRTTLNTNSRKEETQELEYPNEEDFGEFTSAFPNVKSIRRPGPEYSLVYSEGLWVEDSSIVEFETPRKLIVWSVHGPDEYDSDDDSDDEEMPRKHNVMTVSTIQPGPPAAPGKISGLQKSIMFLEKPDGAPVIDLGPPISLVKSTVLAASTLLGQNVQFVDEPLLSESEGVEEDEGAGDFSTSSDTSSDASEEYAKLARAQSVRIRQLTRPVDPQVNTAKMDAGDSSGSVHNSGFGKVSIEVDSEASRIKTLTIQLGEMEKCVCELQQQLRSSVMEREKLQQRVDELEGFNKVPIDPSRKSSLRSQNSEYEVDPPSSPDERPPIAHCNSLISDGTKAYIDLLLAELESAQKKTSEAQKEQNRLLKVVEKLNGELSREPEIVEIVNELTETKIQLAMERAAREKLEHKMRGREGNESRDEDNKKGLFGFSGGKPKSNKGSTKSSGKRKVAKESAGSGKKGEVGGSPRSILV